MPAPSPGPVRWWAEGDVNATVGLLLDNLTSLVILAALLTGPLGFGREIVFTRMIPGTALGVLVGDLLYFWLALRVARRTGRDDVTAMPLGVDTPSLFGLTFGVLGPARAATGSDESAWQIGMATLVLMGVLKVALSWAGPWLRRALPRAALLGSLSGVALLLIAFLPSLRVFADPLVGMVSFVVLLVALFGGRGRILGLPGPLVAVGVGTAVHYVAGALGLSPEGGHTGGLGEALAGLGLAIPWPTLAWLPALPAAVAYLAVALPFTLAVMVGGVDNTESAAAAGDEFKTRDILLVEGVATLAAGVCGGVIQNTPYIGHPAYKAMGARAGYVLATALVIGLGAALGAVGFLVALLPEPAVAPFLVFIGLVIAVQAFEASPRAHAAAVALAFLPAIAALALIQTDGLLAALGTDVTALPAQAAAAYATLRQLANGFIVTALVWGAALAWIIDGALRRAALALAAGAGCVLFGLMHSPRPGGTVFWPWDAGDPASLRIAAGYLAAAVALLVLDLGGRSGRARC
jgi:AGZA family xanthine/uracil permease-like MFS transporter